MVVAGQVVAAAVRPEVLRLGGVRVPVYGVFAALGLVGALWLSQRTAGVVGVSEDKLWDAGMFGVVAAFVASRVLLVVGDFGAFVKYPMLVLALPSLTYGGMAATGLAAWGWLRWKKIAVWDALDAWAPCGALLGAVLALGSFVGGTDAGMPMKASWMGRTQPVGVYGMVAGLGVVAGLWWALGRRRFAGEVAGWGLVVGGVVGFGLEMLRQPVSVTGGGWLEASQWVDLGAVVVGCGMVWRGMWVEGRGTRGGDASEGEAWQKEAGVGSMKELV